MSRSVRKYRGDIENFDYNVEVLVLPFVKDCNDKKCLFMKNECF